jgi:hypothetical protein
VQDDQKCLAARLAKFPVPVGRARSTLPHLSHELRHDFFRRLSEGRTGIVKQEVHGPQTLWTRLANGAENHSGVAGVLADRLMETAGLERTAYPKPPDLAALLRAAVRVYEGRQFSVEARQVV